MFQKGNKLAVGRPKISLNKPELLLPIIFQKAGINWARDFTVLYTIRRERPLTKDEETRWKSYIELMPYLCTKVNIKELDSSKFTTEADTKAMTAQTKALIEALNVDTESNRISPKIGLESGKFTPPPTA